MDLHVCFPETAGEGKRWISIFVSLEPLGREIKKLLNLFQIIDRINYMVLCFPSRTKNG